MVAASGASTTFTKSNGPSVAHWWRTLAPSSSTSRFTSRSRSGLAFSVCTPCAVRLESMMEVGIAPPRSRTAGLYSGRLVEVEEGGAEEEHRRDHEGGAERLCPRAAFAGSMEQDEQHQPGQEI